MSKNNLEATAYHEAGHAVAAYILRVRFHYVTIKPDVEMGTAGHLLQVLHKNMLRWEMSEGWPERYRTRLERLAMISLAGPVALELITGQPQWELAPDDARTAIDMLSPLTRGEPDGADTYCDLLTWRVRNILGAPYPHYRRAIQALGYSLLIAETIKYRDARVIIEKAIPVTDLGVNFDQADSEAEIFVDSLKKRVIEKAPGRQSTNIELKIKPPEVKKTSQQTRVLNAWLKAHNEQHQVKPLSTEETKAAVDFEKALNEGKQK